MVADIVIIVLILIGLVVDIFDLRYRREEKNEDSGRNSEDAGREREHVVGTTPRESRDRQYRPRA